LRCWTEEGIDTDPEHVGDGFDGEDPRVRALVALDHIDLLARDSDTPG
jgi:hypothetical protein